VTDPARVEPGTTSGPSCATGPGTCRARAPLAVLAVAALLSLVGAPQGWVTLALVAGFGLAVLLAATQLRRTVRGEAPPCG
jgi:hypothetical protein